MIPAQTAASVSAAAPLASSLPVELSAADRARVDQALRDSRAANTRAQYRSAWRGWAEWSALNGHAIGAGGVRAGRMAMQSRTAPLARPGRRRARPIGPCGAQVPPRRRGAAGVRPGPAGGAIRRAATTSARPLHGNGGLATRPGRVADHATAAPS